MLKIGVDKISTRHLYIGDIILEFRGIEIRWICVDSNEKFDFYYGANQTLIKEGMHASSVLSDEGVQTYDLTKEIFLGEEVLAFNGIVDPLASAFYHLTRMEEYQLSNPDQHGRFKSKDSFVFKFGWEKKLMTERWLDLFLIDVYQRLSVEMPIYDKSANFILTFDIDNTFAFRWKGIYRNIGSYFKDILKFDFTRIVKKTKVLLFRDKDPYDTYDLISSYQSKGIQIKLFWLLGDRSMYDRNVSNTSKKHLDFIAKKGKEFEIGLHPSYVSNGNIKQLRKEKEILSGAIPNGIEISRQHFLKLRFPETYQQNQAVGMKADYTLGFGDAIGFRAGTVRTFPFFDLSLHQQTAYRIHPFAYMDGTLKEYMNLSISESIGEIKSLIDEVKLYGGDLIAIWHNETISDWGSWKGWRQIIDESKKYWDEVAY